MPTIKADHIEAACRDAWPGTADLAETLIRDSFNPPSWRAGRAGLMHAMDRRSVWMTAAEFGSWVTTQHAGWKARARRLEGDKPPAPHEAIGMSTSTRGRLIAGKQTISKIQALACAHYAFGYEVPAVVGDCEAFAEWFEVRFGTAQAIATWLELPPTHIADRMRGFDIKAGVRHPRAPEIALVRALDWVVRAGPFVPYGEPQGLRTWPGMEVA